MSKLEAHIWFAGIPGNSTYRSSAPPPPFREKGWFDVLNEDYVANLIGTAIKDKEVLRPIWVHVPTDDRATASLFLASSQGQVILSAVLEARIGRQWWNISMVNVLITEMATGGDRWRLTLKPEETKPDHGSS
jgi:hypothetical protein